MTISTASNGDVKNKGVQRKLADLVQATCPHVGLREDPETLLAFAAHGNCCHYAQPAWPIKRDHQEAFCLSDAYVACPMLEQPKGASLLPALSAGDPSRRRHRRTLTLITVAAVLLAGALFAGGGLFGKARDASSTQPSAAAVAAKTTTAPSATPGATQPPPTATAEPSAFPAASETTATAPKAAGEMPVSEATATPSPTTTPTIRPTSTRERAPTSIITRATATPLAVDVTVNVETLNVRNGPGIDYAILDQVFLGQSLAVIGRNNRGGWWQICCVGGDEGWVIREAVIVDEDTDTETVPVIPAPPFPSPTEPPESPTTKDEEEGATVRQRG